MSLPPNNITWVNWDFGLRTATNHSKGVSPEFKYGFNPAINTTIEDVWDAGGVLQFLSSAEPMDIASSSANDDGDPAGTGARTVSIYGVDNNYQPLNETITLNGTTAVTTAQSFLRINRMSVASVGSNGTNVGDITATASTSATTQAQIGAALGSTTKSQYTVPAGYFAFIKNLVLGTQNNDQVQGDLQIRSEGQAWVVQNKINFVETAFQQEFTFPLRAFPKSDIRVQAVKVAGGGDVNVSCSYEMAIVEEQYVNSRDPFPYR